MTTTPTVLAVTLKSVTPLAYNFPIVDTQTGNPTPQFVRLWQDTLQNFVTAQGSLNSLQPGGTVGQIQYNGGGTFKGFTVGGDGTLNTTSGGLVVTKTNGVPFAPSATTDTTNAVNITSGTLPAGRMPALTGDIMSSIGTVATTLVASGVTAGTYGDSTHVAQVTVDAKGRVTAATAVSISGGGGGGSGVLPLVSGDLPGPSPIADGSGQYIGVPL